MWHRCFALAWHQQTTIIIIVIFKYKASLIYTIACCFLKTQTHMPIAHSVGHRSWFCAIIWEYVSSYFTLFSRSFLLTLRVFFFFWHQIARPLFFDFWPFGQCTHDVRTFSISIFLRFYSLWRTRNETRRNKKRSIRVVYYRFVNAEHTQKLHSRQQKEVVCRLASVRRVRFVVPCIPWFMMMTLPCCDEKSQFTYLRLQCRTTTLCTLSQYTYIQTNNDDISQHS